MFGSKTGIPVDSSPRSCVWLLIADVRTLDHWRPLIDELDAGLTRSPIRFVGAQDDLSLIRRAFPNHHSMTAPRERWWAIRCAIMATRPYAIVHIGDPGQVPPALARYAQTHGMLLIFVEEMSEAKTERLIGVSKHAASGADRRTGDIAQAANHVLRALVLHHRRSDKAMAGARLGLKNWLLGRRLIQPIVCFRSRRFETLDALRQRLDRPDTIACLGSGPSSEDPRLLDLPFDRLFRAKWRWLDRGFLDNPDIVLEAGVRPVRANPGTIIGFRSTRLARRNLVGRYPLGVFSRVVEYFILEELPLTLNDRSGDFVPTTGALMLDLAVALRAKRLIVAGFDLFMHPDGAYPGDSTTPNDYGFVHEREFEIDCIARVLKSFDGEVVVIGDILRERLAAKGFVLQGTIRTRSAAST